MAIGGFNFDHCKIDPGGRFSFSFTRSRQDACILTAQRVGSRRPADAAHEEMVFGLQIGDPLNATDTDGNAWRFIRSRRSPMSIALVLSGFFHFWHPTPKQNFRTQRRGRSVRL